MDDNDDEDDDLRSLISIPPPPETEEYEEHETAEAAADVEAPTSASQSTEAHFGEEPNSDDEPAQTSISLGDDFEDDEPSQDALEAEARGDIAESISLSADFGFDDEKDDEEGLKTVPPPPPPLAVAPRTSVPVPLSLPLDTEADIDAPWPVATEGWDNPIPTAPDADEEADAGDLVIEEDDLLTEEDDEI
jgi:hypothetical protein